MFGNKAGVGGGGGGPSSEAIHHENTEEMSRAHKSLFEILSRSHTNTNRSVQTHIYMLQCDRTARQRGAGIDKSLRPERGAEVGLIEMNFRGAGRGHT